MKNTDIKKNQDRTPEPVLSGKGVTRCFGSGKNFVKAVDHIDFDFYRGEIISIVGESGSGKTTLMKMIMCLLKPTEGTILYKGEPIKHKKFKDRKEYWKNVQAIFQDPFSSFNQFFQIKKVFYDCIRFRYPHIDEAKKEELIQSACSFVNLQYSELANKYTFELSGGQMQRLMIARIFLLEPNVLVADEPTSMIDACSRMTILNILMKLRDENNMTIIFITHDLGLAYFMSDRVFIMNEGKFVEEGDAEQIIQNPSHSYTKRLLSDVPKLNEEWILD